MPGNPTIIHEICVQVRCLDENYSPCNIKLDIPCCCPALKITTPGELIPKKPSLIDIPSLRLFHSVLFFLLDIHIKYVYKPYQSLSIKIIVQC
jgi:hypothetical protein